MYKNYLPCHAPAEDSPFPRNKAAGTLPAMSRPAGPSLGALVLLLVALGTGSAGCSSAGRFLSRLLEERPPVALDSLPLASDARLDSAGNFDQYLSLTPAGNDGAGKPNFIGTHRVFAIYEPGTIVQAFGLRNSGTDSGTVQMTISGYLVDI